MFKESIPQKIILSGLILYCLGVTISISCQIMGVILALIGWIIRMIITRRFEIIGTPLNIPILLFIITLFLSTIFSSYPIAALDKTESMIRHLLLYYLVVCGIKDAATAKKIIMVLLIAVAIESGYIILQYLYNFKLFGIISHDGVSKYLTENRAIGGAVGIIFPIGFSLWVFSNSAYKKIALGIINLLILAVLLFTQTRGVWVGVILALIFIIIIGIRKKKKILLSLFAFVIIIPFIFPKEATNQVLSIFSDKTLGGRTYLWRDSLQIVKDYPVFGTGPGTFIHIYYPEYFSKEAMENKDFGHLHCHNNFVNVAVEGGILGLFAFIWLLVASFCLGFKILKRNLQDKDLFPLTIGLLAGLIVWLVHGMVDCTYLGSSAYLFWFTLGMIVRTGDRER
ncbi:MAG: O-antigen ligase family protein [bacterium]